MILPTDRRVFQNSWVVDDLEKAIDQWVRIMGVGPFFILDHAADIIDVTYRGQPAELSMRIALAQAGPVQIEFVQPLSKGPNCYRDTVKPGTMGFHHVCTWTHDFDADMAYFAKMGAPAANAGRVKDSIRFAYFDTSPFMQCMVEVMEYTKEIDELFQFIATTGNNWDGKDPIRTF